MKKSILILGLLLGLTATGWGQKVSADTVVNAPATAVASEHSATKALYLSLLPGAGQIYNGQAWKIPIIYGAFAGLGYFIHSNYTNMQTFKEEYLYRVNNNDTPRLEGYTNYPNSAILNMYQSYNRNFQLMIILSGVVYGLNLVDAYVFGHLYDFQIDDNLSMRLSPSLLPDVAGGIAFAPAVRVALTF
ncbi:MAG: hypothetical protein IKS44_07390 [Bacteroidales bacterium]|nr:hypothetical protein [Bacteroidales bacterium]